MKPPVSTSFVHRLAMAGALLVCAVVIGPGPVSAGRLPPGFPECRDRAGRYLLPPDEQHLCAALPQALQGVPGDQRDRKNDRPRKRLHERGRAGEGRSKIIILRPHRDGPGHAGNDRTSHDRANDKGGGKSGGSRGGK